MTGRRGAILATLCLVLSASLAACAGTGRGAAGARSLPVVTDPAPIVPGTMRAYQVRGRWYQPVEDPDYEEVGMASWYGDAFHGRPTASGERFDMNALTAAHKTLPLPGLVEVTNLANGRTVVLRVNDRGPFVEGRIIDLSRGAAEALGMMGQGVGEVRVRYVGRAPRSGGGVAYAEAGAVRTPRPPVATERAEIWVQVGAFSERPRADRAAERLGDRAQVQVVERGTGRLYRVVAGPWGDANAAEAARQAAIARGFPDALLISGH
ncbi:septal ring lytic transglycosylase RlpA family protein [Brevundimonas vitis]|uniref:Endolytic peptidoglycan transglycosylase RlpA n=1 Tax=Brevundimonas vitisensis TaxID=2800818 RepID=A0ABX7BMY0_9CAUL|nr:septal ring lytic transglycosylase RlpA family protein [Brevundimonas vitisensis]QQQ18920.1 septal ring lytic transglycosylase RlpA family protein [Brevundimonas vitisensis]